MFPFENHIRQLMQQSDAHRTHSRKAYEHGGGGQVAVDPRMDLDDFDRQLLAESRSTRVTLRPKLARVPDHALNKSTGTKLFADRYTSSQTPSATTNSSRSNIQGSNNSFRQDPRSSPLVSALGRRRSRKLSATNFRGNDNPANTHDSVHIEHSQGHEEKSFAVKQQHPIHHGNAPVVRGVRLVPVTDLPDQARSIFKFTFFNVIQSRCFPTVYGTNDNLVVAAPTGSGKTAVMELAIARSMVACKSDASKIVYQAPTKSLCAERCRDWQSKFGPLGLECAELTGDTDATNLNNVKKASIIVTTPEKWDSITRKWKDHTRLLRLVKLFLIDEVHILKEPRGATLETVVSRMKTLGSDVRFVALSATVPNSDDIASWLGKNADEQHLPATREVFGEDYRPVKLEKHVIGIPQHQNDFAWAAQAMKGLPSLIAQYSAGKPSLVFCATRKNVEEAARLLANARITTPARNLCWSVPKHEVKVQDGVLSEYMKVGVAFHHGGLEAADRHTVEQAFLHGDIGVICCTSTLAVGVNLPCYLAILLGTRAWADGRLQEYSDLEVMQMLGRAGRPQFETKACAVIITPERNVGKYQKMVSGQEILESCLHQHLIEHLNAEIGLGVIRDMTSARRWLEGTFLSIRMKRNPNYYQLENNQTTSSVEQKVQDLCSKDIKMLEDMQLISASSNLKSTDFGEAMARYCVRFETMKVFLALPPKAKVSEILMAIASAAEYRDIKLRAGEKQFYKDINGGSDIKYPIQINLDSTTHKVSLIVQSELGQSLIPTDPKYRTTVFQHKADKIFIFAHASRLIRCIIDCQLSLGDAVSARNALLLSRSLDAHAWDDTASQLRQLYNVGNMTIRKLAAKGINSIEELCNNEASRLEIILGKTRPFGTELLNRARRFPILRVSIREIDRKVRKGVGLDLKLKLNIGFVNDEVPLRFERTAVASVLRDREDIELSITLKKPANSIKCHVMCDGIAGTCRYAELRLNGVTAAHFPTIERAGETSRTHIMPLDTDAQEIARANDFDDYDINDDDLMAVEIVPMHENTVRDIDDLVEITRETPTVLTSTKETSKKTKRKSSNLDDVNQTSTKHVAQRVRLENGNWSCNHKCKDKTTCNHECCRTGLAKPPKRPPHLTTDKHTVTSQQKSNAEAGNEKLKPIANQSSSKSHRRQSVNVDFSEFDFEEDGVDIPEQPSCPGTKPARISRQERTRFAGSESESDDLMDLPSLDMLLSGQAMNSAWKASPNPAEIPQEERISDKEDEQKKKWAEFPSWLYDEFHEYVDII